MLWHLRRCCFRNHRRPARMTRVKKGSKKEYARWLGLVRIRWQMACPTWYTSVEIVRTPAPRFLAGHNQINTENRSAAGAITRNVWVLYVSAESKTGMVFSSHLVSYFAKMVPKTAQWTAVAAAQPQAPAPRPIVATVPT